MKARAAVVCSTVTLLAACGGGGGGGAPDPSTVTISEHHPDALHLDAYAYNIPAFDLVYATIDGIDPKALAFGSVVTGTAVQYVYDPQLGGDGKSVSVLIDGTAANDLCPGTYTSEVTFHVCTEPTCAKGEVNGSPLTIPVTYDVTGFWPDLPRPAPTFELGSLHFGVGQTPAASDLRRTFRVGANPPVDWIATSTVSWLSIDPPSANGGPVTMTASLVPLAVATLDNGTYTGSIVFNDGGSRYITVPVDLTVNRSFAIAEQLQNGSFAAGLQGWQVYAGANEVATTSTDGGVLKVTPVAVNGANEGEVLLTPDRTFSLAAGRHYRLSFDAWADAPRKLSADVQAGNTGMGRDFVLSTTRQHFDVDAVFSQASATGRVDFGLGGNPAPVYLDDVSFHEVP